MLWRNVKYAVKMLLKSPLLSGTAVVALALGIGANTALFSVIDAVLLRPLEYPHAERIVEVVRAYPGQTQWATTPTKFAFWKRESHSFEAMAAHGFLSIGLNLVGRGEPQRLTGLAVSADYFKVLGVEPMQGRGFTAAEDKRGAGNFAVLSYGLWRKLYGNKKAVGGTLSISDNSYQVIGVMPRGFDTAEHPDLWVPLQMVFDPTDRSNDYPVTARLKAGVTMEQARADMRVVAERFRKAYGRDLITDRESIGVLPLKEFLVGGAKRPLYILLAAVGFVLLIACANVANLLLARSAGREREMAVRVAVGASSGQIVGQLLTESLLLALAGAAAGCLLAGATLPLLLRLTPKAVPQLAEAAVDGRVLLFALGVAVLTGLLFGLFPALQSARQGIANPLRESGTRTTTNAGAQRVRQGLVIAEMAVTLLLLIGASLLLKTLSNLRNVAPGFDARHVLTMEMSWSGTSAPTPEKVGELERRVAERIREIPGVESVGATNMLPMTAWSDMSFEIVGRPTTRENMPDEKYRFAAPDYFATLRIPVRQGREFTQRDAAAAEPVMVINEALARQYFKNENPLGRQIWVGRTVGPIFADKVRRIVGVVGDTHDDGLDQPAPPQFYVPLAQMQRRLLALESQLVPLKWLIRTAGQPGGVTERVRREALTVVGDMPMGEPKTMEEVLSGSLARQRFVVMLLTVFAGLALLLGSVGLYGVVSYSVAQRTRELGIRSALGAQRGDLLRLVVGEGMRLTGVGLGIGLVAALGLTRYLQSLLYGVSAVDPVLLGAGTGVLAVVGLVACFVPAFRASRVDPLVALHQE